MKNQGTDAERMIIRAFTLDQLRLLFTRKEFQDGIAKMKNVDDAEGIIATGNALLQKIKNEEKQNG